MLKIHEILDRYEIMFPDCDKIADIRRAYIDKDINSIFRILDATEANEDIRKAVAEQNIHSIFRLLDQEDSDLRKAVTQDNVYSLFRCIDPTDNDYPDLRKAVIDQNIHSIFRLLDQEDTDLRKAVTEHNIYSIFRLVNEEDGDLRKAVLDQNMHSVFRLIEDKPDMDDLRKAVTETNLYSIFRLLGKEDTDLRKAVTDSNLHSIFRLLEIEDTDLRKAVLENNWRSIFRLVDQEDSDLRKAIIDQNVRSIFRVLDEDDSDLRKAVTDHNMRSLFRVVAESEHDDNVRKLLLDNNVWSLWKLLEEYTDTHMTHALKLLLDENVNWDCMSQGQLKSKKWLVDELKKVDLDLGDVVLCAGWYGTLATMLFESGAEINKIVNVDMDRAAREISWVFNKPWRKDGWRYTFSEDDIHNIPWDVYEYQELTNDGKSVDTLVEPTTIINTSCEHIDEFAEWYDKIPYGKILILQSNNYHDIEEHVNTHNTLNHFEKSTPMNTVFYSGELELSGYKRFMRIGIK